jgi:hypothetical protein
MKRIPTSPRVPNPHGKLNEAACPTHRIYKRALRRAYDQDNREHKHVQGIADRCWRLARGDTCYRWSRRSYAATLDRLMYQISGEKNSCRHYHPHFESQPRNPRTKPWPGTKNGYFRYPRKDPPREGDATGVNVRIPFLANITPKPMRKMMCS